MNILLYPSMIKIMYVLHQTACHRFSIIFQDAPEKKEKTLTVLSQQRAKNILIMINRFPAARHVKTAILGMDHSFFTAEIIEVHKINWSRNLQSVIYRLVSAINKCIYNESAQILSDFLFIVN